MAVNVGTAIAYLQLDSSGFKNSIAGAGADLKNFAQSGNINSLTNAMTATGSAMTKGITLPIAAIGTVAAKSSMDFDSQMSKVKAISGAVGKDFEGLREQAIKLGADTSFSAGEAANGMENLASAGFSTNEIMSAMPGMLSLAAAGGVDIATASDIAGSSLRGFGLEASNATHIADVLAKVAGDTNAGITDTGEAMKYIAPVANALGVSFEETSAAIGLLSNSGIKGSQAGTTLRSAMTNLAAPTKAASKTMQQLGMNFFDAQGKMKPMGEVISILQEKTKNLTSQQKASTMETLFGKEAMSGMMVLVEQGPEKFDKLANGLKNCDGASKEMADTMLDNVKGSIEAMKGSIETAAIRIGDVLAPTIKKVAIFIDNLVSKFSALPKPMQEFIVKSAILAAVIGPIMILLAKLITSVKTVVSAFKSLSAIANVFKLLPALISPPVLITVGIIGLIAGAAYLVIKNWKGISTFFSNLWNGIKNIFSKFWEWLKGFFKKWGVTIMAVIMPFIGIPLLIVKHWSTLSKRLSKICSSISSLFKKAVQGWKNIFNGLLDFFKKIGTWITDGLLGGLKKGWEKVSGFVKKMGNGIKDTFKNILDIHSPSRVFKGFGENVGEGFIEGLEHQDGAITNKITGLADKIKGIGNVVPDFAALNSTALGGIPNSNQNLGVVGKYGNDNKGLHFNPNIVMHLTLSDIGDKGTKEMANNVKTMTQNAMKDAMTELFMSDAIRN